MIRLLVLIGVLAGASALEAAEAVIVARSNPRVSGTVLTVDVFYAVIQATTPQLSVVPVALDLASPSGWTTAEATAVTADALAQWGWTVTVVREPSQSSGGTGGPTAWGGITGTLSAQTDLQGALDGKAASGHTHAQLHDRAHSVTSASDHTFPGGTANFLRADGTFATPAGGGGSSDTILTLASQISTGANTTPVSLTGMAFTADAGGIYQVSILAAINNAAATTGYGIGVNCAQVPQGMWLTGTSQLANTGTVSGWQAIANNAIVGVTSGVPTANTDVVVSGGGLIRAHATVAGTCTFIFRSEVAAVARMQPPSKFIVRKLN